VSSSDRPSRRLTSSGALVWRNRVTQGGSLEVLIVHPGGPFFASKDLGAWSLPKGVVDHEIIDDEALRETAMRELDEEAGLMPEGELVALGSVKQKGGKTVYAFAIACDEELPKDHRPPQVRIEYPPGSMRELAFPEVDKALFVPIEVAREKLNPAQVAFLDRLVEALGA